MDSLPNEILCVIIGYLYNSTKKKLKLSCKLLYKLMTLNTYYLCTELTKDKKNLILVCSDIEPNNTVEKLRILESYSGINNFFSKINSYTSLVHLEVDNWCNELMNLVFLKYLKIKIYKNKILELPRNLETFICEKSIKISNRDIDVPKEIVTASINFFPSDAIFNITVQSNFLVNLTIENLFGELNLCFATTIKHLTIISEVNVCPTIDLFPVSLHSLELRGPGIKMATLYNIDYLTNLKFLKIEYYNNCKFPPYLEYLDLYSEESLLTDISYLKNLKHFIVSGPIYTILPEHLETLVCTEYNLFNQLKNISSNYYPKNIFLKKLKYTTVNINNVDTIKFIDGIEYPIFRINETFYKKIVYSDNNLHINTTHKNYFKFNEKKNEFTRVPIHELTYRKYPNVNELSKYLKKINNGILEKLQKQSKMAFLPLDYIMYYFDNVYFMDIIVQYSLELEIYLLKLGLTKEYNYFKDNNYKIYFYISQKDRIQYDNFNYDIIYYLCSDDYVDSYCIDIEYNNKFVANMVSLKLLYLKQKINIDNIQNDQIYEIDKNFNWSKINIKSSSFSKSQIWSAYKNYSNIDTLIKYF